MPIKIEFSKDIKHDLDKFIGKPAVCKMIITDIKQERYSSEIHLRANWKTEDFTKAITDSYKMCDNLPVHVFVESFNLNLVKYN